MHGRGYVGRAIDRMRKTQHVARSRTIKCNLEFEFNVLNIRIRSRLCSRFACVKCSIVINRRALRLRITDFYGFYFAFVCSAVKQNKTFFFGIQIELCAVIQLNSKSIHFCMLSYTHLEMYSHEQSPCDKLTIISNYSFAISVSVTLFAASNTRNKKCNPNLCVLTHSAIIFHFNEIALFIQIRSKR